jgi:hypothetical protein
MYCTVPSGDKDKVDVTMHLKFGSARMFSFVCKQRVPVVLNVSATSSD